MGSLSKWGAAAALYMGLAYALGIYIFLVLLDYPNMTSATDRVDLLSRQPALIFAAQLVLYVIFGIALTVLVAALHAALKPGSPGLTTVGSALGMIWAGSLVAAGMVTNAGIAPALALHGQDPALAAQVWAQTEAVAEGLGNGNGEVLGGMMTLLLSLAGWKTGALPRALGGLGIVAGLIGLASVVPALVDLAGAFGIAQGIWFFGLAWVLSRERAPL